MSRTLVVVAHPDDESVWCGGWLLQNPGTDVCCCGVPDKDPERLMHFFAACFLLGAHGFVVGQNCKSMNCEPAQIFAESYDDIITHNELGEYGHPMHIKLHHAMKELKKPMRVFNYGIRPGTEIDYEGKLTAIRCYISRPDVLKNQSRNFDLSRECLIRLT
ncbi:MAG: hypothetical protein V3U60_11100 [Gammaproteobacteria bacterium]